MELFKELLAELVKENQLEIVFPQIKDLSLVINNICYNALAEISKIVKNDELSDPNCFEKIEEIILVLEKNGINFGYRHDF